jgi:chitodextrinase
VDAFAKFRKLAASWRHATCEIDLLTTATKDDGTTVERTHTRRAVCKRLTRRGNVTIAQFADVDRAALDREFPFDRFTVADFPELYVDHVNRRIPQGVGTVVKVPLTWITKTGGTWKYAGPRLFGANTLLAVYRGARAGEGALVDPSEYTSGTAIGASSGVNVSTVNFTREQIDFNGRPYVLEADYSISFDNFGLVGSIRNPTHEIARILTAYGIAWDFASFSAANTADFLAGIDIDALYGGAEDGRTGTAIVQDLLRCARAWLAPTASGTWAMVQDVSKASSAEFDTRGDEVDVDEYGDADNIPQRVSVSYRPAGPGKPLSGRLERTTAGATGELKLEFPYVREHVVADRLLSYWSKRVVQPVARATLHAVHLSPAARIDITAYNAFTGAKSFLVMGLTRPADANAVRLREYSEDVYVYTAGTLPADATNTYAPDYSYTRPAAPTGLAVVSQGTSVDSDGKLTAYALIRAVPPAVNWSRLMVQVTDGTTNEIYQAQLRDNAGNYEAMISGLRPGRTHNLIVWAVNANNLEGLAAALGPFTSANSANAPAAATLAAQQLGPRQITVTWSAAAPGAGSTPIENYIVHRRIGAGSFAELTRTAALKVIDDSVTLGTAYQYKVQAVDRNGNVGTDSNVGSVTPTALINDGLIVPQGVGGASIANSSINQGRSFTGTGSQSGTIGGAGGSVGWAGSVFSFAPAHGTDPGGFPSYFTAEVGTPGTDQGLARLYCQAAAGSYAYGFIWRNFNA